MMVGTSEEPMLSSKLTAVEKRDPTAECLWGNISLNGYGIRFYPGICTSQEFCRGTRSPAHVRLLWGQKESPGHFGPDPTALAGWARAHFGFKQA